MRFCTHEGQIRVSMNMLQFLYRWKAAVIYTKKYRVPMS